MALDFARIDDSNGATYPAKSYDGQEDQSYGFQPAFKLQTGNTRGVQTVGYGGAKIDGANNRIVITNSNDNTSIGMGTIPGSTTNEFGFFSLDANGNVVMKIVNGTMYVYNPTDGFKNVTQAGLLPDGSGGFVVAKPGLNVAEVFT